MKTYLEYINEKTETMELKHNYRRGSSTIEYVINPSKNEFWDFQKSVANRYHERQIIRGLVSADTIVFWVAEFANHDDVATPLGFTNDVYYDLVVERDGSLAIYVPYDSEDTKKDMIEWISGSKLIHKLFDNSRKIEYIGDDEDIEDMSE